MKVLIGACLVGFVACGCGPLPQSQKQSDLKIVGGEAAGKDSPLARSVVSLIDHDGMFCSGTLISKRLVLTAAHCLVDLTEMPKIGFGHSVDDAVIVDTAGVAAHRNYVDSDSLEEMPEVPMNDIGLVRLSQDAPISAQPATLVGAKDSIDADEEIVLAGFGVTQTSPAKGDGTLRVVSSKIQRTVEKRQEIEYGGHQGRSACMGDSGGPAFIKRNGKLILAGITARGSSECDEEGVETDVRYFHGWIRKAQEALELVAR